ncbi:hypothetical protein CT157_26700 [Pseudomonas syringae]|uniref:Uncharacterized protein n=1 Tax=Pseudomonas syringae TaxID=317 RepID=A0A3T0K144_PSESX|nr:hypothetical protein CT157_26700 [Pseudomonas syringae]
MCLIVPTLCVGMPQRTLRVRLLIWDAERPGLHSHAERGNDHAVILSRRFCVCSLYPRFLPSSA